MGILLRERGRATFHWPSCKIINEVIPKQIANTDAIITVTKKGYVSSLSYFLLTGRNIKYFYKTKKIITHP